MHVHERPLLRAQGRLALVRRRQDLIPGPRHVLDQRLGDRVPEQQDRRVTVIIIDRASAHIERAPFDGIPHRILSWCTTCRLQQVESRCDITLGRPVHGARRRVHYVV
jgi:hypothetical protein